MEDIKAILREIEQCIDESSQVILDNDDHIRRLQLESKSLSSNKRNLGVYKSILTDLMNGKVTAGESTVYLFSQTPSGYKLDPVNPRISTMAGEYSSIDEVCLAVRPLYWVDPVKPKALSKILSVRPRFVFEN